MASIAREEEERAALIKKHNDYLLKPKKLAKYSSMEGFLEKKSTGKGWNSWFFRKKFFKIMMEG